MPEQVLQSRVVRRRNPRPINSCVECRTRKSRCSKTHPCQNCTAFGRDCVFITVPESATRRRQRDSSSKSNADWTQPIPLRTQSQSSPPEKFENTNTNTSPNVPTTTPGTPPRDYEWEAYQQHVEVDGDAWEKLPAEPEETPDDVYEDENDDEDQIATDLTIRIGRMIICENITGFFRPQYAEEVLSSLSSPLVLHRIDSFIFNTNAETFCVSLGSFFRSILLLPHRLLAKEPRNLPLSYLRSICRLFRLPSTSFWGARRLYLKEMILNSQSCPHEWR